ncbi:MAG TPA: peptidase C45 [Planctomycetes bacterium]|nr:peptidase C45 [Planctomycetota bacterium]|tara:strand:+ start:608 stop:1855 length:1248 start_codon:yes stop_codon:yes gene_type:complete
MHRTITHVLLLSLLALAPLARAEVVAREGKGYLEKTAEGQLILHLKGKPYEMGYQHGKLVGELARTVVKRIVHNDGKLAKSDQYTAYELMRPMMHDLLRPHIPARFKEEMRGLAEGAGVPYKDVEAGNLFPAAFHCSGMALRGAATKQGQLYHVRILDYMTRLGLQDCALIIKHYPEGYQPWINVGFAGFIGTVTGMNAAKVSIGEMGGEGLGYWDGMPMPMLMRDALERAKTAKEAVEIFRTTKRTCEYYYVFSDGKTKEAYGAWTTPKHFEVVKPGESFGFFERFKPKRGAAAGKAFARDVKVIHGKHRTLFKAKGKVTGFIATPPKDVLVLSGYDRYQHFMERLDERYGKIDEQALIDMVKRPVSMKSNLHVAIFKPETLEVWVAVAGSDGSPACNQRYHHYRLAEPPSSSK